MSQFKGYLGITLGTMLGLTAWSAQAFVFPVASTVEWPKEIQLLIESEISRLTQEGLKYKELLYTDLLGRVGGAGLENAPYIQELKTAANNGASTINATAIQLKNVADLGTYTGATQKAIEDNYVLQANKMQEYTDTMRQTIINNQKNAMNQIAKADIAMAAAVATEAKNLAVGAMPDNQSQKMAQAKDVLGSYELIVGSDRRIYERSLQASALDASKSRLEAMKVLQRVSATGQQAKTGGK